MSNKTKAENAKKHGAPSKKKATVITGKMGDVLHTKGGENEKVTSQMPMREYAVAVPHKTFSIYDVKATSPEEAIRAVANGEAQHRWDDEYEDEYHYTDWDVAEYDSDLGDYVECTLDPSATFTEVRKVELRRKAETR